MATTVVRKKTPDTIYPLKRGDSFQPVITITIEGDVGPYDFSAWEVNCQIRDPDNASFVSGTTVIWIDHAAGVYQLFATVDTNEWTVGDLLSDIQYTTDTGEVMSTETFAIRVIADVTRNDATDPESAAAV